MEIKIKKPFFPYQKGYNFQVNGVQIASVSLFNNKVLSINGISDDFTTNQYNVTNVEYKFEYQDISITRNWKLYRGKDLKRIYKISYIKDNTPVNLFVKLNIWQELRLKWFWGKWKVWFNEPKTIWDISSFLIGIAIGIISHWIFSK